MTVVPIERPTDPVDPGFVSSVLAVTDAASVRPQASLLGRPTRRVPIDEHDASSMNA